MVRKKATERKRKIGRKRQRDLKRERKRYRDRREEKARETPLCLILDKDLRRIRNAVRLVGSRLLF